MRPKVRLLFALVVVLSLLLGACGRRQPTPTPTPRPAPTPETKATVAPAPVGLGKIVIATDAAFPPMEFVDANKQIVGFDIDMMNAIAERMGLEIEYKNTAWDGIFAGLESGDYDAILSSVTITDERKQTYDFSDPYINAGQAVVVVAGEMAIQGDKDLAGKTVGAQIGTTGAFAVQKIAEATLKEYDTIDLAFMDLLAGNVDAVVVDTPVAADYALASDQFRGKLKIVGEPFTDEYYGLVVRKGQMQDLLKAFNEGLKAIKADGTYDAIYAKWISGEAAIAPVAKPAGGPGFPVKVAIVVPLSGDVKTFGESTRDGAMMAIEEARAAG
ncbi:MAG: transporter substrate-binding domain-containing protein, partial [Chloroflexi bacterium]|nr:transporter substrate-binding domain-containing protein [Chloroflexota bacterium]